MREICFRLWNKEKKEWIYSFHMANKGTVIVCNEGAQPSDNDDRFVIMQFTGLFDKHLVGIYEGDIVVGEKYPYFDGWKPNYVAVVEWRFASFHTVLHCVNKNKRGISNGINEPLEDGKLFKIIGNIYENPELIAP
jgi:uncharacterized phage protein (TIGR01671 family)